MKDAYSASEIGNALGISRQAVAKKSQTWLFRTEKIKGGIRKLFIFDSLPSEIQKAIIKYELENSKRPDPLLSATAKALDDPEVALKKKIITEVINSPRGERKKKVRELAEKYGKHPATIYRWIKRYNQAGLAGLAKAERKKAPRSWSPEALEYWEGLILKREHRSYSLLRLYRELERKAHECGWKIGKRTSAYQIAQKIDPRLKAYRDGGKQGLDNKLAPIRREYDSLMPCEMIVGDQHRFDFWVWDEIRKNAIRPEGYFWLDIRTRLIYGFAVGRKYNAQMMALALKPGLMTYGKFTTLYNDNGKPERAKLWQARTANLEALGLEVKDLVDMQGVIPDLGAERIFAKPYNAKAKPIENFFRHFEQALQDEFHVPGRVIDLLKSLPEGRRQRNLEIIKLISQGKILTFEEFLQKIFQAVKWWNEERVHQGYKMNWTPLEEYLYCYAKGWRPVYLDGQTVDLLTMYREVRKVTKCEITINREYYAHSDLAEFEGQKVQVRFDPVDMDRVIVLTLDGDFICEAKRNRIPMGDKEASSVANKQKAQERKLLQELYQQLTRPVKGLLEYSKTSKAAHQLERARKEEIQAEAERLRVRTKDELQAEIKSVQPDEDFAYRDYIARMVRLRHKQDLIVDKLAHYDYLLQQSILFGVQLSDEDKDFIAQMEAGFYDAQRQYWQQTKELYERVVANYKPESQQAAMI